MDTHPELRTIRDFIRFATSKFNEAGLFYGHGTDNGWDEASALVLHFLHLSHFNNSIILDANLVNEEKEKLIKLIKKRIEEKIPVPYLTHEAWFAGMTFYVDERVLIPRSSIAELIENHFQPWVEPINVVNVLDLCTGSGCIAIACAKAFPEAMIEASDISTDALAVAKINTLRHNVEDQVKLIQSDLFENIPKKKYDIIVTNPPYVSTEEMQALPAEYLHEPKIGLIAGSNGLDFVKRILASAGKYLSKHGILVVEVGNSEQALINHYQEAPFTWLDFEKSAGGVFILTAEELNRYQWEQ